ncbi:DNA recombination protein RmuC [Blochmannia endosymbiont of Polyrhachis (Hedomyrma) turneri]|uniref:DNA recombination protein RmuC n=1 Tax=Blochmannia endosymbiont of Polyrhachis (Hedomyrma) turneri TaxID=1505596 RepID=UPI00061A7629|nr:DNA recombination protein RmuC [Blochmannia endosymbiont of Polyrhachis (Hedomyrma) turneri]AKC60178.1 DNA recombination protein rmuC [Blochmannia endosymbiont of Polyrhachis (Hedomyrma) turneri]
MIFWLFLGGFGGVVCGILCSFLWFFVRFKEQKLEWLKQRVGYEHTFQSLVKDLDRELSVRKDVEQRLRSDEEILKKLYAKIAVYEEQISVLLCYRQKHDVAIDELRVQREVNVVREFEIKQMMLRLEEKNLEILEKEKFFFNFEQQFSLKFENLVNCVFEYNNKKINIQNKSSLDKLLLPLKLQLDGFSQEIKNKFSQEECERHTLLHEINNLKGLSQRMAEETINLTRALKGNNKLQGNWGEVVLSRVLESSGMREGYEFHTQANFSTDNGRRLQPDVIVHLPDNKDVIIDAKTSLLSYEQYFNAKSADERKIALTNYISSLRSHMKLLSKKDYQSLYSTVQTLDYVLMFIPIESAFMIALSQESALLTEAMEYNIILVSPTTLLVALRIINHLWRHEYQNRHTKEIAERASRLYDKFRLFIDDINKLGQYLDKVQDSYQLAKNKLFEGSGNLISQAERFRLFGVKIKRPIVLNNRKESSSNLSCCSIDETHDVSSKTN